MNMNRNELQEKANRLSTDTCFKREYYAGYTTEYHVHPDTKEIVLIEWRAILDGECISHEYEVVEAFMPELTSE